MCRDNCVRGCWVFSDGSSTRNPDCWVFSGTRSVFWVSLNKGERERVWHRLYARDSFLGGIEKMYGGEIFWTEIFLNFFFG